MGQNADGAENKPSQELPEEHPPELLPESPPELSPEPLVALAGPQPAKPPTNEEDSSGPLI